jgi:protein O-mannosyl-transferase
MERLTIRLKDAPGALPALLWPLLASLMAWLAWPGLGGPFIFDDMPNLERLRLIGGQLDWTHLGTYLANFHGNPGRPLATLSFLLNDVSWPSTPRGFKYTNLMLHALAGLMAFGLARAIALAASNAHGPDTQRRAVWFALLASALWMLHPMQTSAVFLVVQRMAILSALFVMAGLWSYVALLRRARSTLAVFVALSVLALFTGLAFLCKENGALAPLYAWVLHATVLRPLVYDEGSTPGRVLARWAIPTAAILPFLALFATPDKWLEFGNREYTAWERLLTQPRVLLDYLQAIVLPRLGGGGSIFHDDYAFSTGLFSPASTFLAAVVVLGLLVAALAWRRSRPWPALAVLWFLAGHSVESTFVSLELYFEHRNYLPMLGLALGAAHAVTHAPARWRRVVVATAIAWLLLAALVTRAQAQVWGDEALMSEVWAIERPDSSRAVQLLAKVRHERGNTAAARAVFASAAESGRGNRNARLYVLLIDCYTSSRVTPEQLSLVGEAVRREMPDFGTFDLMTKLREQAAQQKCVGFTLQDWQALSEALLANPRGHDLYLLHHERARAFQTQRNFDAMIQSLIAAYQDHPEPDRARIVAIALLSGGLLDEARKWAVIARDTPAPILKRWLNQSAQKGNEFIAAIDRARADLAEQGNTAGQGRGTDESGTGSQSEAPR